MKTLQGWHKSDKYNFDEYVMPKDEIDEELYYYFLEILPPIYHPNGIFQVSEPYSTTSDGHFTYGTYQSIRTIKNEQPITKYFYLGNMTKLEAKEYSKVAF